MSSKGWVKIDRNVVDHWIFKDAWNFRTWIDLLLLVNHKEEKVFLKGELFICGRGETIRSLETLAIRWGCDKSKVRRFLKLLESDQMIETKSERKATRVKVLKYDEYQNERHADETQMKRKRNANETPATLNKNEKKEKNEEEEENIHFLQTYIREGEFDQIRKLKNQLSFDQCQKLLSSFMASEIEEVLLSMENFKDLPKKYSSVYLTVNNWLKRRKNESTTKNNGSRIDAVRNF
jgi:hypothetical protein